VGAVLEDASFHPGRTARNHLRVLAATGEHPQERVDVVLAEVGLTEAADRRVKGYSMGMRQRLAIAAALLGDPSVLILDEPTNGLDPPGIHWMRGMLRDQASRGRAVLVSSHLLAEVAQSVDDVVVIAKGELRGQGPLKQVLGGDDGPSTEVRARDNNRLARELESHGHTVQRDGDALLVLGVTPEQVGAIAGEARVNLIGLAPRGRSLETAFFALTAETT
jgi:ABC-2 type transport system ATP-binding protein